MKIYVVLSGSFSCPEKKRNKKKQKDFLKITLCEGNKEGRKEGRAFILSNDAGWLVGVLSLPAPPTTVHPTYNNWCVCMCVS